LSHSEAIINPFFSKNGSYGFPAFSGNLTRILKNGVINDIGGVANPLYNTAKKWDSISTSFNVGTLDGFLAKAMKDSVGSRFDRYTFGPGDDLGISSDELHAKPSFIGGDTTATLTYGVKNIKIAHIDIEAKTVKIWESGSQGAVYPVKIVKPNPNIILAI